MKLGDLSVTEDGGALGSDIGELKGAVAPSSFPSTFLSPSSKVCCVSRSRHSGGPASNANTTAEAGVICCLV